MPVVDNTAIAIRGKVFRTAKVRDEPYECLNDPDGFIQKLKGSDISADLFTFMQEISERSPKHSFHLEWDSLAVIPVTTYENWWKKQISDKTRNVVRKAQKNGVELRAVEFTDDFVRGVMEIFNESPVRQGKPFTHYGKDFETIKQELITFLDRSDFVGAFYKGELIGFIKFVRGNNAASLMQIISKISHRDKAPSNALIAKAVEMCAEKGIAHLHYGIWSSGGLGVFKTNHAFTRLEVPRYFVPLNLKGKLMLRLKLHHKLSDHLPEKWLDRLIGWRNKWNTIRGGQQSR